MLINELADDCLLPIFDFVNDLDDLINCYKVCVRWSNLIAKRTRKVKYLLEVPYDPNDHCSEDGSDCSDSYLCPFDCVYYQGGTPIDETCLSTLFPKLIILEFTTILRKKVKKMDIVSFVRNHESLKGVIDKNGDPTKYCDKLEMLFSCSFDSSKIPNGSSMKQLNTAGASLEAVKRYAHDFPNLEMLRMSFCNYDILRVPVFEKLKILVLHSVDGKNVFYGFQLMDSCPNLQSAFINMQTNRFFVDETLKHECLQDLVIGVYTNAQFNWNDLKRLLMKYPNLKHLSLRNIHCMKDEHVVKLVRILPNLVLLNIANWPRISKRAVDIVDDYCKRNGRSIKCYVDLDRDKVKSDWPQLSTKEETISRGFDFMKHCFLKDIYELPHFLVPIEL
ncbi:uncharacterized protein LOC112538841 isoform X2 [Tetranychus urticae]|uniref:uncharacterized protein LOC112538841 isoform X2 n=1 Tax=Tetranychus urticae TaxID=32264 RepID=UPI000D644F8C|nr:uncharacterized protein LOC112538841 isoform X2 [Tetranychus urticae]